MNGLKNIFSQIMKMQDRAKEIQSALEKKIVEGSAGGDMVVVRMNGKKQVLGIKINKEAVNSADVEMLEDLIVAAINQAHRKAGEAVSDEIGKLTGGMNIPGMPDISGLI